ncbi:MAG: metallopeptidase family protein [Patescibacteria group bacterium]
MTRDEFEKLVAEEFPNAIPEQFRSKIKNVAFLIEDVPSEALRREENLAPGMTLLGHYRGIPNTARGAYYGMGATLPDTITLFAVPILEQAYQLALAKGWHDETNIAQGDGPSIGNFQQEIIRVGRAMLPEAYVRQVIRDTIWHEVFHHFGADESAVRRAEEERQHFI